MQKSIIFFLTFLFVKTSFAQIGGVVARADTTWFGFSLGTFDIPALVAYKDSVDVAVSVPGLDATKLTAVLIFAEGAVDTSLASLTETQLTGCDATIAVTTSAAKLPANQLETMFCEYLDGSAYPHLPMIASSNYLNSYRLIATASESTVDSIAITNGKLKNEPLRGLKLLSAGEGFLNTNFLTLQRVWLTNAAVNFRFKAGQGGVGAISNKQLLVIQFR
jgi:hypothetical protein